MSGPRLRWLAALALAWPLSAGQTVPQGQLLPEGFLHLWDPVTLFFQEDVGPAQPEVELSAERYLTLSPPHPGALVWVDRRTLQFRPAEPWRAFARYTLTTPWGSHTLLAVPDPPLEVYPRPGEEAEEVAELRLVFRTAVEAQGLAEALRLTVTPRGELRQARRFAGRELELKVLEGREGSLASYTFRLPAPLPPGSQGLVELVLPQGEREVVWQSFRFATASGFSLVEVSCGERGLSLAPSGVRLRPADALPCAARGPLTLRFSRPLAPPSLLAVRNLVRLTPPVPDWSFEVFQRELTIRGSFAAGTTYRLDLTPAPLESEQGKKLSLEKPSVVYLAFPEAPKYLSLAQGNGIVERFGPKMVPVTGRGQQAVEVALAKVEPKDKRLWPFPSSPPAVDETEKPAPPGEEPQPRGELSEYWVLRSFLRSLAPTALREVVSLPASRGGAARFGFDLAPLLAKLTGEQAPAGTFLLGMRRPEDTWRQWMAVQVTDLALTTVEGPGQLAFAVSSLGSGQPVAGARVEVEGFLCGQWQTLLSGATDAQGLFVAGPSAEARCPSGRPERPDPRRIVVTKGEDTLVLDCERPPELYFAGRWTESRETWLAWSLGHPAPKESPKALAHIFPERPVYRPEEAVHLKGYVRLWQAGRLAIATEPVTVVVEGEGGRVFRLPLTLTPYGSFYLRFAEPNLPTGLYKAWVEAKDGVRLASTSFRKEAYRVPEFEVTLTAPDAVPLDREFEVKLVATYYAGGKVAGRPVRFRVTQYPYHWQPPAWEGFAFSSDARYGGVVSAAPTPTQVKEALTDDAGAASLTVNPAAEETAHPRQYLVEATVVGADDQTVTASRLVRALPPFVLGLKLPRYLPGGKQVEAEVLVVDGEGKPLSGQQLRARLKRRSWHSVLQASDFTLQAPKYLTDVVDEVVEERALVSEDHPVTLRFPLPQAGVFLVELEGRDRLGRSQRVALDFFAGGEEAVSWPRKESKTFRLVPAKPRFTPGEEAEFLLESPYQNAWGLVVVEAPQGNLYRWVRVEGGKGSFRVPVEGAYAPAVPVHCLLMRGRLPGVEPLPGTAVDLGKPATVAASSTLTVDPKDKRVEVRLEHKPKALPGEKLELTVKLADERGNGLAGEVTLWLVDLAVLALGKEQPLDPLPSFLLPHAAKAVFRDTRNLAFGMLPLVELPGGEQGRGEAELFEQNTVRRRLESVPYYNPSLEVGPTGVAKVTIQLPDNLTIFAVRAKAVAGAERFGFATSRLEVRRPLVAQPVLPRFLRFGDKVQLGLLARVVEGGGGAGRGVLQAETLGVAAQQPLELSPTKPALLTARGEVPELAFDPRGQLPSKLSVRGAVERLADGARDAVEVSLPLRAPYAPVLRRQFQVLDAKTPLEVPPIPAGAKPASCSRRILLASQPAVAKLVAALSYLHEYPFGCTEQRLSRARSFVAHKALVQTLGLGDGKGLETAVADTLAWLPQVLDQENLVAFWPRGEGKVYLTAWAVEFLTEAKEAGFAIPEPLLQRLVQALERAVRGQLRLDPLTSTWERAWALLALAQVGKLDLAAAAELARTAQFLDLEGKSQVVQAFARAGLADKAAAQELVAQLAAAVRVRSHQGREVYGGLEGVACPASPLIFPSETRTMAEVLRALAKATARQPKLPLLLEALVRLGEENGWGSTNANAAACLALAEVLQGQQHGPRQVLLEQGSHKETLVLDSANPLPRWVSRDPSPVRLTLVSGEPVGVVVETSWLPAKPQPAGTAGFVVQRQWVVLDANGNPKQRLEVTPDTPLTVEAGALVEEQVELVNPEDRAYVAVVAPLAAGMEPLNPYLATAPPEAKPSGTLTLEPTYRDFRDDQVSFFYDWLPKGTYRFSFRTRAQVPGTYHQPAAFAELMYQQGVRGWSASTLVEVKPKP
jgi:uncharacterized protein YfaS (alpha-2-macroglobulin family)